MWIRHCNLYKIFIINNEHSTVYNVYYKAAQDWCVMRAQYVYVSKFALQKTELKSFITDI